MSLKCSVFCFSIFTPAPPPHTHILLVTTDTFVSIVFPFPKCDKIGITQYVAFSGWLFFTRSVLWLVSQLCLTLCNPMGYSLPGCSVHGHFLGKNTGVVCHALLQGIFPTQGSNQGLPHCKWILYHLSHQGSPFRFLPCLFIGWQVICFLHWIILHCLYVPQFIHLPSERHLGCFHVSAIMNKAAVSIHLQVVVYT